MRADGRRTNELRPLDIQVDFLEQPHGCVLYGQGKTIVLCTATIEESVPRWLMRSGRRRSVARPARCTRSWLRRAMTAATAG